MYKYMYTNKHLWRVLLTSTSGSNDIRESLHVVRVTASNKEDAELTATRYIMVNGGFYRFRVIVVQVTWLNPIEYPLSLSSNMYVHDWDWL